MFSKKLLITNLVVAISFGISIQSYAEEQSITLESKSATTVQPMSSSSQTLSFSDGQSAKISNQSQAEPTKEKVSKVEKNEKPVKLDKKIDKAFEKAVTKDEPTKEAQPEQPPKNMPVDFSAQEKVDAEYIRLVTRDFSRLINEGKFEDLSKIVREHVSFITPDLKIHTNISDFGVKSFSLDGSVVPKITLDENYMLEFGSTSNWALAFSQGEIFTNNETRPFKVVLVLAKGEAGWKIFSFTLSEYMKAQVQESQINNLFYLALVLGLFLGGISTAVISKLRNKE